MPAYAGKMENAGRARTSISVPANAICPGGRETCETMIITHSTMNDLYIRTVRGMGRGVFANKIFIPDELIEVCPLITFPYSEEEKIPLWLTEYAFDLQGVPALALGYGSLYNHSSKPNASYFFRPKEKSIMASITIFYVRHF